MTVPPSSPPPLPVGRDLVRHAAARRSSRAAAGAPGSSMWSCCTPRRATGPRARRGAHLLALTLAVLSPCNASAQQVSSLPVTNTADCPSGYYKRDPIVFACGPQDGVVYFLLENVSKKELSIPGGLVDLKIAVEATQSIALVLIDPVTNETVVNRSLASGSSSSVNTVDWQGVAIQYHAVSTSRQSATFIGTLPSNLTLRIDVEKHAFKGASLTYSYDDFEGCPTIPVGCDFYNATVARELVLNWSTWAILRYPTESIAWQALCATAVQAAGATNLAGPVPFYAWEHVWSQWPGAAKAHGSWQEAFKYIDSLYFQDNFVQISEFIQAYKMAGVSFSMFTFCVALHTHFPDYPSAWQGVGGPSSIAGIDHTRWRTVVWPHFDPPDNFTKASADESFKFADANNNGVVSRAEFYGIWNTKHCHAKYNKDQTWPALAGRVAGAPKAVASDAALGSSGGFDVALDAADAIANSSIASSNETVDLQADNSSDNSSDLLVNISSSNDTLMSATNDSNASSVLNSSSGTLSFSNSSSGENTSEEVGAMNSSTTQAPASGDNSGVAGGNASSNESTNASIGATDAGGNSSEVGSDFSDVNVSQANGTTLIQPPTNATGGVMEEENASTTGLPEAREAPTAAAVPQPLENTSTTALPDNATGFPPAVNSTTAELPDVNGSVVAASNDSYPKGLSASTSAPASASRCCVAATPECLACQDGMPLLEFCGSYRNVPGCKAVLDGAAEPPASTTGAAAGPEGAAAPPAESADEAVVADGAVVPVDARGFVTSNMSGSPAGGLLPTAGCPYEGVAYTPIMVDQNLSSSVNVADCQATCLQTPGCMYFTSWRQNSTCSLHDITASWYRSPGAVSGPRICVAKVEISTRNVSHEQLSVSQQGVLLHELASAVADAAQLPTGAVKELHIATAAKDVEGNLEFDTMTATGMIELPPGWTVGNVSLSAGGKSLQERVARCFTNLNVSGPEAASVAVSLGSSMDCILPDTQYEAADQGGYQALAGNGAPVTDMDACRGVCLAEEQRCQFFTYWEASGRCLLLSGPVITSSASGVVAGALACSPPPPDMSTANILSPGVLPMGADAFSPNDANAALWAFGAVIACLAFGGLASWVLRPKKRTELERCFGQRGGEHKYRGVSRDEGEADEAEEDEDDDPVETAAVDVEAGRAPEAPASRQRDLSPPASSPAPSSGPNLLSGFLGPEALRHRREAAGDRSEGQPLISTQMEPY